MIDSMTAQKLVFTGQNYNAELRAAIDSISSKPRFLDKALTSIHQLHVVRSFHLLVFTQK